MDGCRKADAGMEEGLMSEAAGQRVARAYPHELEWNTPMYRLAVEQLDRAAARMGLDPNLWERLRTPQRAYIEVTQYQRL